MIKQLFGPRFDQVLRTRSAQREAHSDEAAVQSVAAALERVIHQAEAERAGLKTRLEDVLSRAAIVGGNQLDDYLTRTNEEVAMLKISDAEIRRGEERLKVVEQNISHFKHLRAALQTRFPNVKI